jgi:hypothetical protein
LFWYSCRHTDFNIDIPHYDISFKPNTHFYQFISSGPKGKILKGIQFSKVQHDPLIYNLALGDIDPITNKLDDKIIADNKDRDIILATVGHVELHFCKRVGGAGIIAIGIVRLRKDCIK